jgi:hypothetical protein
MKRLGIGKKGDGDDESTRSALFGGRSKSKSPAPASNPYARPAGPPDPYTQAKMNAGVAPPRDGNGPPPPRGGPPQDNGPPPRYNGGGNYWNDNRYGGDNKYGPPQGGYGGGGGGYGGYGGGGGGGYSGGNQGYGSDRYGGGGGGYSSQGNPSGASRYGSGGYGGLGRTVSNDTTTTDDNRDALFGGAAQRVQQQQQQQSSVRPGAYGDNSYGDNSSQGYGAYQDRQLTAEEEEEEDVTATKQEIRFMKQQDVSSTRNALRVATEAEETGRNTLARLGAQGERIHNTEKNLDLAANHNRIAEEKARELKTLNKSMFAVHVANPFTGAERRHKRDEDILNKHREEREEREKSREAAFQSNQRMDRKFRDIQSAGGAPGAGNKASLAERAKYQFEADSEDDEMENEIDSNLDALSGAAGRLNLLARATGEEIEAQNRHLDRITGKVSISALLQCCLTLNEFCRAIAWTTRFI